MVFRETTKEHWFNFDDRRVKAMRESDISRFYGGKECAYMLFYRRKSLSRPAEAQGNKEHLIPQHILQQINEENRKIREERYVLVNLDSGMMTIFPLFGSACIRDRNDPNKINATRLVIILHRPLYLINSIA